MMQKKVLLALSEKDYLKVSLIELADKIGISRAMLYRNIDELRDMGYISTGEGLQLTDTGKNSKIIIIELLLNNTI